MLVLPPRGRPWSGAICRCVKTPESSQDQERRKSLLLKAVKQTFNQGKAFRSKR